ncbi:MAG: helix-hairpin-helix domain-containing protein, partial [Prevotellaceae bacterium]|nr:helix-hairpin-helix domain-containing protein [Prevotellaceae bacterium]
MNALRNIILTFCLFLFGSAFAQQQTDVTNIIEGIIEQISENSEREIDVTELVEDLQWFAEHPINLNNAKREEFERLGFLSGLQIENLMFYLYRHSPVASIYELQLVEGLDSESLQNLLPFVYVGEKTETQRKPLTFGELMKRGRNNVYLRANGTFEEKAGYTNDVKNPYLGEPFYASARYLFSSSNKLFFGIVAEKDEGEPFWTSKNKGFDFYSAHFQLRDVGRFKNIVAGDYRASFGLGLVVSNNFLIGKSSAVLNVTPTTTGLRHSSSMQEYNFLRGVGTTVNFGKFD